MSGTVSPEWNTHGECGWCKGVTGEGPQCWCAHCHGQFAASSTSAHLSFIDTFRFHHMYLCPDCGNKRCPRATHHDNDCTGSNDYGQEGSRYGGIPPTAEEEAQAAVIRAELEDVRDERRARTQVAEVRRLHQQYRPAALDDYDCCGHCNSLGNGYVKWPCPTIQAIGGEG